MARRKPAPAPPAAEPPAGPMPLSPTAKALFDEIAGSWDLTPPVRALLRLACEAHTKAEECERITAAEGMTIGDQKGAAKPHPAALLARDYRAQCSTTLQRILSNLEG
jgi:phage terminase small subunit